MEKRRPRAWIWMALLAVLTGAGSFAAPAQDGERIRVACLGDSITAGQGARVAKEDTVYFSYPAALQRILGPGYEVRGFGAGGHALRSDARLVYPGSKAAARAIAFAPNVAIIMLGTNDSVLVEPYTESGERVDELVAQLRAKSPDVAVWLSSPPQMFAGLEKLSEARRANLTERWPRLQAISEELRGIAEARDGVTFVDVRDVLRPGDVTDGVHPTPIGASRLAYRFAETVLGRPVERTVTPVPSAEYRGQAAGWGGGTWKDAFASLVALGEAARGAAPADVLFLGDSITQGLTGHGKRWSSPDGGRVLDEFHGERRAVSLGLSGDRTEHLLFRIRQGSLDGFRPRRIVLQIGINNVNTGGDDGAATARGVVAVTRALEERFPEATVLVTGPFPGGIAADSRVRRETRAVHAALAQAAFGPKTKYQDLSRLFVGEDGALLDTMRPDGIHVTRAGQRRWMEAIEPFLAAASAEERDGNVDLRLGTRVRVSLDASRGEIESLTVGEVTLTHQPPRAKAWSLNGRLVDLRMTDLREEAGCVSVGLEPDGSVAEIVETWRVARLGSAHGYDRRLTMRDRRRDQDFEGDASTLTRSRAAPFSLQLLGPGVVEYYGYSTVSEPGVTYRIRRIRTEGSTEVGTEGWWFRSGIHGMNQALNAGIDPSLREVVLLEEEGGAPVPFADVVRAYVDVAQDRASLLQGAGK